MYASMCGPGVVSLSVFSVKVMIRIAAFCPVTVKVVGQIAVLPAASLTVRVIVYVPGPTSAPAGGSWVTTTGPLQSLATTSAVKFGTAAWQFPSALALRSAAQVTIAGGRVSVTVKVAVQTDSLLAASFTCRVTVVTPNPTRVPEAGVCVTTSGPLQSLATTPAVKFGTDARQVASAEALRLAAQLAMEGGVLSVTRKLVVHWAVLPEASLAVTVIACGPKPTSVPARGD